MQFQNIMASIALTASAIAAPAPNGGSWGVPGQDAQNQCSNSQVAACCTSASDVIPLTCTALIRKTSQRPLPKALVELR